MPKCNQCDSMTINGVYCHERGCPNTDRVYVDGEWVYEDEDFLCDYEEMYVYDEEGS